MLQNSHHHPTLRKTIGKRKRLVYISWTFLFLHMQSKCSSHHAQMPRLTANKIVRMINEVRIGRLFLQYIYDYLVLLWLILIHTKDDKHWRKIVISVHEFSKTVGSVKMVYYPWQLIVILHCVFCQVWGFKTSNISYSSCTCWENRFKCCPRSLI